MTSPSRKRIKERIEEASDRKTDRMAITIAQYTNKVARIFATAPPNRHDGLMAALVILGQCQTLATINPTQASKLLATAKRVSQIREDEE